MASITLAGNFNVKTDAPIDTRFVVNTYTDLESILTYEGLEVWVIDEKIKYRYVDKSWLKINEASDSNNDLIWEEYDT